LAGYGNLGCHTVKQKRSSNSRAAKQSREKHGHTRGLVRQQGFVSVGFFDPDTRDAKKGTANHFNVNADKSLSDITNYS
jgi:hypothetical protein